MKKKLRMAFAALLLLAATIPVKGQTPSVEAKGIGDVLELKTRQGNVNWGEYNEGWVTFAVHNLIGGVDVVTELKQGAGEKVGIKITPTTPLTWLNPSGSITIGDDTMIAYGTIIHTSTHDHTVHPMRTIRIDRPVSIGKHVWIGTGAIILPGVKIGDYAVVGAGSVVNRHVAEGAVVAGNPAKIVKFRDLSALKMVSEQILTLGFLPDRVVCKDFTNK